MSPTTSKRYPAELKQRAVRMYGEVRSDHESDWAAMEKVAQLLGIGSAWTLRKWIRQAEVDQGAAFEAAFGRHSADWVVDGDTATGLLRC